MPIPSSFTVEPALPPPYGQTPNFVNPESLSKWNALGVPVCLSITTIVFSLRTYVRVGIKRERIFEDWLVCVSWSGLVTYCALMTTTMYKHGGVHEWDMTLSEAREVVFWFNITSVEYAPTTLCTKLAVLQLYHRGFLPRRRGYFDWALRVFMTILILLYVATTIVKIWECTPRENIWNKSIPGTYIDVAGLLNISGLFNTMTITMILLVPVKCVWRLQMTKERKVEVAALFTVGFTTPVFDLISFIKRIKPSSSPDVTRNDPELKLWAAAEIPTGLICICIPTFASLAHRQHPTPPSDSIIQGRPHTRRINLSEPKTSTRPEETRALGQGKTSSCNMVAPIPLVSWYEYLLLRS